jgi:two-component system response regulator FixJ
MTAIHPVYIIDDEQEVRVALNLELRAAGIPARPFGSAADFLEEVPHLAPGCLLLDIRMPGKNGIELLAELAHRDVRWPTVMMTGHAEVVTAVQAMKLGAIEFLEKPFGAEALHSALDRGFAALDSAARRNGTRSHSLAALETLTPRELEVLRLVAEGATSKVIAARLGLSHRTVEMHRANMMRKMGAATLIDLVRMAGEAGIEAVNGA